MTLFELLPFVLIGGVFWLLILRPAKARRQEQVALQSSLAPGQRIMTTAGLFGTVVRVDPGVVAVEVASGVVVEMVPQAVGRVVPAAAGTAADDESTDGATDAAVEDLVDDDAIAGEAVDEGVTRG